MCQKVDTSFEETDSEGKKEALICPTPKGGAIQYRHLVSDAVLKIMHQTCQGCGGRYADGAEDAVEEGLGEQKCQKFM